ncbi:MAG: copper amine oxidase N-terminal domain-containing protein, partial [Clostridia bacterium]|nr:copper amine oxidase N-terminal domain-containing protein [Clostridia bacterium]
MATEPLLKDDNTYIIITPSVFPDKKEWSHTSDKDKEQSFGYMLGGKKGVPVTENPSVDVEIPKDGNYKIYVLGNDSSSKPGTRFFDVVLGDVAYRTGNHGKNGFCWQASGELAVTAGKTTVMLSDVSGNYSRCAAIVITDDFNFNPGADNETVATLNNKKYNPNEIKTNKQAIINGDPNSGSSLITSSGYDALEQTYALGTTDFGDGKNYVVIMPNSFSDLKDWMITKDKTTEQSYSYLRGGKAGVPVENNPSLDVFLPTDGTYKIYVLSKDFTSDPGTRYYDIILGGVSYRTGNHGQQGFLWQSSEPINVTAGKTSLSVVDVSGNYSRCAAIVITDNLSFDPGTDNDSVTALAEKASKSVSVTNVKDAIVTGISTGDVAATVRDKGVEPYALKADKTYIALNYTSFENLGSWTTETADGMTYMVGGIDGTPAQNNPNRKIVLPKDGTYKIYAYAKDFVRNNPGSRHFEVVLGDGVVSERLGTHSTNGFNWQDSSRITVFGGETSITVKDSSGNTPRLCMLVITDDLEFDPKCNAEQLTILEEKLYKEGEYSYVEGDVTGRPDTEIAVKLNGDWMQFDVDPVLLNNRTMVPFRAIFEALGCTVSWDGENQTAIGMRNGRKIILPIGSLNVSVNDVAQALDQPAVIKDGRTLVPLRFVSEALGAQVKWFADTRTVSISASVPFEKIFLTLESFSDMGTWVRETKSADAFNDRAMKGTTPSGTQSTFEDADPSNTKPAVANIDVNGGNYYVWGHAKDFTANSQGARFMNVGFDDMPMMENRMGDHGAQGYKWELLGDVELSSGRHKLKVYDTSGFYARFDGIILTTDPEYVPSEVYETIIEDVVPVSAAADIKFPFPKYANEQSQPTDSYSIENEKTKVVFYKVPTSQGQVVQREIYSKSNGTWVKTTGRDEDLGYYVVRADKASYTEVRDLLNMQTTFTYNGETVEGITTNPYVAGVGKWFIPTDYTVDGNKVILNCPSNEYGTLVANWSLDDNTAPLVSVDVTFARDGFYTVGVHEGKGFLYDQFENALAPFRVIYKRVSEKPQLYTESYLFTPMGSHTLYAGNEYSALPVTKGVVAEPSWIPVRWVYENNNLFGITLNDMNNMHQAALFAPVLGSDESNMKAGSTYNVKVRMISTVNDWFGNYQDTVTNLFDVTDYRKNYVVSLNQAIFNARKTSLDDKYGGWDVYDKAHYNMETGNR